MADPTDDDDDEDLVPIKRQPKMLSQQKSLPSVDGALDDFIVSANQKLLDVTEFTAENREQQLRGEIAELEKKLASAQSRLDLQANAPPPESLAPKRSWGMVVVAFVLGGGIAFGAAKAMQPAASPSGKADVGECTTPAHEQVAAPAAPPPTQPAVASASQPPATPTTPTTPPTDAAPPTVAAKQAPKQTKAPKAGSTAQAHAQPEPDVHDKHHDEPAGKDPTSTKPPPTQDGSGSDLYNPF